MPRLRRSGQSVAVGLGTHCVDMAGGEVAHVEVVHRAVLSPTAWGTPCLTGTMALKGRAAHQQNPLDVVDTPFISGSGSASTNSRWKQRRRTHPDDQAAGNLDPSVTPVIGGRYEADS